MSIRPLSWIWNSEDEAPQRVGKILCALVMLLAVTAMVVRAVRTDSKVETVSKRPAQPTVLPRLADAPVVVVPSAKFEPAAPERLGRALNDSALNTLIDNFIVASSRNDAATQKAMLSGMQRDPGRSRELLRIRLASGDGSAAGAIDRAMAALNGK